MKKFDIIGIGESLIDFLVTGDDKTINLVGNAGGGPVNMLAAAAKLGLKTSYISMVGEDPAGKFFLRQVKKINIDISNIAKSKKHMTTLAIVKLTKEGERSFAFYNKQTADTSYGVNDVNIKAARQAKILHFSTVNQTTEAVRNAEYEAIKIAKKSGGKISFDMNLREFIWQKKSELMKIVREDLKLADYVKLSEEELFYITGEKNIKSASQKICKRYKPELLVITCGAKGAAALCGGIYVRAKAPQVKVIDTTGAGDAFFGAALSQIISEGLPKNKSELERLLNFSCVAGSLSTTKKGGTSSMPNAKEIAKMLKTIE